VEEDGDEEVEQVPAGACLRLLVQASSAGQAAEGNRASYQDAACGHPSHGGIERVVGRHFAGKEAAKCQQAHDTRIAGEGNEELGGVAV
jgi:hypothetical protein